MFIRHKTAMEITPLALILVCFSVTTAGAQTGSISGTVVEAENDSALAYANVMVPGTPYGAMCLNDGTFKISGLPAGSYTVVAMMMGYERSEKHDVIVESGQTTQIHFKLLATVVTTTRTIIVKYRRPQVEITETDNSFERLQNEIKVMPLDNPVEVVGLVPGFVTTGDEIHSRGGRAGETRLQVNGIPVMNPFGGSTIDVSLLGTSGVEVISGGMDAEYGDAQSAIVNITTREGGDEFGGEFRYFTDDFGRQDKTYTNFDRLNLGLGGPTWFRGLRYYVSGQASFSDTENTTIEPRKEHKITEWLKFRERQMASYNLQSKLTWKRGSVTMTGEAIVTRSDNDSYLNNWNIQGYVKDVLLPTVGTGRRR